MLAVALLLAVPVDVTLDSGLFANTIYHVVCLAEQISCSRERIERFWNEELEWGDGDEQALSTVKSALGRLDDAAGFPEAVAVPPNFSGYYPGYRARYDFLSSILQSGSAPAVAEVAAASAGGAEAQRLAAAFGHFEDRLRPWWETQDSDSATEYGLDLLARMEGAGLWDLADQLADFLEADVAQAGIHTIIAPYTGAGAFATIMGRHLFIEFSASDTSTDGAWKALHEFTHILYDNGPINRHQELIAQFLEAEQPHSMAHYVLLNEAIGTASQLIAFERLEEKTEDFYSDQFIPRIALSTQPLLEEALATGSTLYTGFSGRYMLAADAELTDQVRCPQYMLLGVGVLGTERHPDAAMAYFDLIPPRSVSTAEDWVALFPEANVVRLLTHDELGSVKDLLPAGSPAMQHRGFAYSPVPTSKRRIYLFSGRSEKDLVEAVREFSELDDVTPSGFLVAFD